MMLPELMMLPLMLPPPAVAMLASAFPPKAETKSPVALALDCATEFALPVSVSVAMWERFAVMVPALVMPPLMLPPAAVPHVGGGALQRH